eukprot:TRINITY_DN49399_c0_g1_i1.p1 TRINITY_DN49399_c0_g1~~TRINITY_DN49399_c0_g1_i1.p1  ORF type:complete len:744 (+),score=110.86 TRINITY_DN49399_c0_g1_i1:89-2233(+)
MAMPLRSELARIWDLPVTSNVKRVEDINGTIPIAWANDKSPLPVSQAPVGFHEITSYCTSKSPPCEEDGFRPSASWFSSLIDQHEKRLQKLLHVHEHNIIDAVLKGIAKDLHQHHHAHSSLSAGIAPGVPGAARRMSMKLTTMHKSHHETVHHETVHHQTVHHQTIQRETRSPSPCPVPCGRHSPSSHASVDDSGADLAGFTPVLPLGAADATVETTVSRRTVSFAHTAPNILELANDEEVASRGSGGSYDEVAMRTSTTASEAAEATRKSIKWNVKDAAKDQACFRSDIERMKSNMGRQKSIRWEDVQNRPLMLAEHIANSRSFELLTCSVILANALVIGSYADWSIRHVGQTQPFSYRVLELCFLTFFTVEWILRIVAERKEFCWGSRNIRWNFFDSLLVVLGLFEEIVTVIVGTAPDVGAFRVLRMLRVMRISRVIRVFRFFKELRVMVSGIVGSLHSLMWALILLFCIKYMFALVILQFTAMEFESPDSLPPEDELMAWYGSLSETMYTLFLSICGGVNWKDSVDPLMSVSPLLGITFCFYIAFAMFCVLNIVTGVFVESAKEMTADDQDMVLMEQLENREKWFDEVKAIFESADSDGSGCVDGEEFTKQIKEDVRLQAQFRKLGVHVEAYSASGLFQLLDFDGNGELDLDEFCLALQMVHGPARSIDVAKITHDTRVLRRGLSDLIDLCSVHFDKTMSKERPSACSDKY